MTSTTEPPTFADLVKTTRSRFGLTQLQVADKLDLSQSTISEWESGRGCPSIEGLVQFADMFDLELGTLTRAAHAIG